MPTALVLDGYSLTLTLPASATAGAACIVMTAARRDDGFTLVELLVTMVLGMVVLGGLVGLLTTSEHAGKRISDRVDAAQRGRNAMESMTQELRAMVCLPSPAVGSAPVPIVSADATQVTWYANLDQSATVDANGDGDAAYDPQQRRLRIVGNPATGPVTIFEDRWTGALPVVPATAPPTSTRVVLDGVLPSANSGTTVPFFSYYGLLATPVGPTTRTSCSPRRRSPPLRPG